LTGSLSALNKYFLRYKKKLLIGAVCIIFSNVLSGYVPLLVRDSIDSLTKNPSYSTLTRNALLIIGATIIAGVFRFMIRQTIIVFSRDVEYDLRGDFWEHLQKLPLRFFQNNSTGNLMSHATNDINAVRSYLGPAVMYSMDTSTKFIVAFSIMISLSWKLTLYSLLPLPILSFFVYNFSKKIHKKFTLIQEKFSELTTRAQENFSGIRVIKSYVREDYEINEFTKLSQDYLKRNMDKVKIQALFMPVLFMTAGLSTIIAIGSGGIMVMDGTLTLGTILAFTIYLGMLIWPTIAFGFVANLIQQSSASMKRILKILNEPYEISDSDKTKNEIQSLNGEIEFDNVSFRYGENLPWVLKNINLKIEKGKTAAFIGHTGVGKTTLINLIPRLYDVVEGNVRIDGTDVREIPLETLRKNIGLSPQETFLFSDTLANNLLYGLDNGTQSTVEKVSEIAQLSKDVDTFPVKYDTILGERGITLSGGQKQRSSLARALAIDPKILILDDSFSAVDTNTEEDILKRLKDFMKERTSIIISHRISTVKNADKIFVLNDGIIAEEGTHNELVGKGGIYADLHEKQLLEEELKEID
jgi:ATP-binding cassette subfamily B protein